MLRIFLVLVFSSLYTISLAASHGYLKGAPIASFTSEDTAMMENTIFKALDTLKDGEKLAWKNDKTGNSGLVNPIKSYQNDNQPCRTVRVINRSKQSISETTYDFCLSPDKEWKLVITPEK